MITKTLALTATLAAATSANAAVVPSSRFLASAQLQFSGDAIGQANSLDDNLGALVADFDSPGLGSILTTVTAGESSLSVSSDMTAFNPFAGYSLGSGRYDLTESAMLQVDWNWIHTDVTGGWRVLSSTGAVVASLTFSAGAFTSQGGSFGTNAAGNASMTLAAGTYTFEAYYSSGDIPSVGTVVNFNFGAIPAPGALALLGAAGLVGTKRRRA